MVEMAPMLMPRMDEANTGAEDEGGGHDHVGVLRAADSAQLAAIGVLVAVGRRRGNVAQKVDRVPSQQRRVTDSANLRGG